MTTVRTGEPRIETPPTFPAADEPSWHRRHLLDLDDFTADELELVMRNTDAMKEVLSREVPRVPALRGTTIVTLFYENSTRTRASFELAGKVLGADVINVAASGSSITKGESLVDTVKTLQAIGADVLVMRHHRSGAPYLAARHADCGVINAGDGLHAHPTQGLLDLYTMRTYLGGDVRGKRVVIVGDILHSRVARSNTWALTTLGAEVVLCAPPTLLPAGLRAGEGLLPPVRVETDLDRAVEGADVVMALRMQLERMQGGFVPGTREYSRLYQVNTARLARAKPGALVMHPGPMNEGVEISHEVAHGLQSRVEEQVTNGVAVRMAVLWLTTRNGGRAEEKRHVEGVAVSERIVIRGGRVIDPMSGFDARSDVLIEDGRVTAIAADIDATGAREIDASGLVVSPGLVDIHTHLRDPGFEYKEDIESGTWAAARGGFTTVCAMPNTDPPLDTRAAVEYVLREASARAVVRVLPIGAVSRRREGRELAELGDLAAAGCVAFSDDGAPVSDATLMRRALEYASTFGLAIIDHCEDPSLAMDAVMNESWVSTRLGLRGMPAAAEEAAVARDLALAEATGAHVHIAHVSTRGAIEAIRSAKRRGVHVTCEVTPHHLTLTDEIVAFGALGGDALIYETNAKVNPPLRSREDVDACVTALGDGTIDCIATDHAPHALVEKLCEFDDATFGISGIETAFGLCMRLVHDGRIDMPALVERLTRGPARALGLDQHVPGIGTLAVGAPADVVLLDPDREWIVEPERFASKGKNTPLAGITLRGAVVATIAGGVLVHRSEVPVG